MCGIIGYLGNHEATPLLLDGLKSLEYRGYDSAGIAVLDRTSGLTSTTKSESKVALLTARLQDGMPKGRLGIGHTRWATHGSQALATQHPTTPTRAGTSSATTAPPQNPQSPRASRGP